MVMTRSWQLVFHSHNAAFPLVFILLSFVFSLRPRLCIPGTAFPVISAFLEITFMSYKHSDTHRGRSLPTEFATVVTDESFISKWELSPITDGDEDLKTARERYVYDVDDQSVDENRRGGLPYSKARCIALVATATGASFTGVSIPTTMGTPHVDVQSCITTMLLTRAQTFSVQAMVIIQPLIGKDLNIPDSRLQWIVSAYALAFGCFLLFWGRIADIYGKKNIFIYGTAWVGLMTVVNPFIENEIIFNLLRGLQGLVGGITLPKLGSTLRYCREPQPMYPRH